jgi:hypothetical protein
MPSIYAGDQRAFYPQQSYGGVRLRYYATGCEELGGQKTLARDCYSKLLSHT